MKGLSMMPALLLFVGASARSKNRVTKDNYDLDAIKKQCDAYFTSTGQRNVCNYAGILSDSQVATLRREIPKPNATAECKPQFMGVILRQKLESEEAEKLRDALYRLYDEEMKRNMSQPCDGLYFLLASTGNRNDSAILKSKFGNDLDMAFCHTWGVESDASEAQSANGTYAAAQKFLREAGPFLRDNSLPCPEGTLPGWAFAAIVCAIAAVLIFLFCLAWCCCGGWVAGVFGCLFCCCDD